MFARTPRLLLRPAWGEDASALFKAIADEKIVCNLAQAPWPYRPADAEAFIARERTPHEPASLVFLRTQGAPRLIGGVGFGTTSEGETEFGYWIARPYWGLGFATEAARAAIDNARHTLRVKRLVAGHFLDNPASGRVLRKLGFEPTGVVRARYSAGRGVETPTREYALDLADAVPADRPCEMMAA